MSRAYKRTFFLLGRLAILFNEPLKPETCWAEELGIPWGDHFQRGRPAWLRLELRIFRSWVKHSGPWFNSQFGQKLCSSQQPCRFRIPTLNKGGPPIVTFSMGRAGATKNSANDTPCKCWVKDSVGQFLQTSDTGQDMKEEDRLWRILALAHLFLTWSSL